MITTGFKFYFGLAAAFFVGAIAWGYSTGGEHVGPLTLGWKGGVGDHVGYLVLIGLGFATACFAGIIIAFRDADPAAQAHYMGVETIVSTTPTTFFIAPDGTIADSTTGVVSQTWLEGNINEHIAT